VAILVTPTQNGKQESKCFVVVVVVFGGRRVREKWGELA
jgi:hypothetical protein